MERAEIEKLITSIKERIERLPKSSKIAEQSRLEKSLEDLDDIERALKLYGRLSSSSRRRLNELERLTTAPSTEKLFKAFVQEVIETREAIKWADTFLATLEIRRREFGYALTGWMSELDERERVLAVLARDRPTEKGPPPVDETGGHFSIVKSTRRGGNDGKTV